MKDIYSVHFPNESIHPHSILISLPMRSMWETICDAVASSSGMNLCSKFLECPHSSVSGMLVWNHPRPPPPHHKWNLGRSWHFEFELVWSTTPLPKMKIWAVLGTLSLSWSGLSPPPTSLKMKIWEVLEILGRSWHFEFELVWSTPPPPPRTHTKLKFGKDLALWVLTTPEYPPSEFQGAHMETNFCIPCGYLLVVVCACIAMEFLLRF